MEVEKFGAPQNEKERVPIMDGVHGESGMKTPHGCWDCPGPGGKATKSHVA